MWLALWFLSCSWLFLSPVFVPPTPVWGAGAIALALVAASKSGDKFYDSFILCGLILLAQAAALPLVYFFGSRYHQIPFLQHLVYPILRAVGLRASLSGGSLFVQTVERVSKVSITLERLGFFPFLIYLFGGSMLLFLTGQSKKRMGKFFFILCGYAGFRFFILLLISLETNNQAIFWSSIITSLSFLPLAFLLIMLFPWPISQRIRPAFSFNRQAFKIGGLVFICSLFLVLAIGFHDPGVKKPGRILIDEKHSEWEWTDEKFDTHLFGKKTDYNFYCLSEYLTYFYPQVKKNHSTLTSHILADTDVLILKTPTREYSDKEVEAIQNFVAQGGGLFLIGDHTNVFGMSTYLNKVATRFNLRFRYDVTYDLPTYQLSLYRKPRFLPHPVVQYIPVFLFGSSCTLAIPLNAESVITGYGLRNHYLDYSQKNFFPIAEEDPDYEFGLFVQSAALTYKKGRVLAYSDSTCFSNFFMFIPGKPELLLGSIEWLNRKNKYGWLNLILFLISLGGLFYLLIRCRAKRKDWLGVLLIFGLSGLMAGFSLSHFVNQKNYKYPQAKKNFFRVALESEHSSLFLPVTRLAGPDDKSFLTFFVWTQRLGYVPCLKPSLEEAMKNGQAVVLIDPIKNFTQAEISKLKNYLRGGGVLLLMDSPQNQESTANQLLKEFDLKIGQVVKGEIFDQLSTPLGEFDQACQISGGASLLRDQRGISVLSTKRYGAGLIAVFTASHLFRDKSLGYTNSIPDEYQHWLSEIEFWIFNSLAHKKFKPFSIYSANSGGY